MIVPVMMSETKIVKSPAHYTHGLISFSRGIGSYYAFALIRAFSAKGKRRTRSRLGDAFPIISSAADPDGDPAAAAGIPHGYGTNAAAIPPPVRAANGTVTHATGAHAFLLLLALLAHRWVGSLQDMPRGDTWSFAEIRAAARAPGCALRKGLVPKALDKPAPLEYSDSVIQQPERSPGADQEEKA